jgi:hypothetical protein
MEQGHESRPQNQPEPERRTPSQESENAKTCRDAWEGYSSEILDGLLDA